MHFSYIHQGSYFAQDLDNNQQEKCISEQISHAAYQARASFSFHNQPGQKALLLKPPQWNTPPPTPLLLQAICLVSITVHQCTLRGEEFEYFIIGN